MRFGAGDWFDFLPEWRVYYVNLTRSRGHFPRQVVISSQVQLVSARLTLSKGGMRMAEPLTRKLWKPGKKAPMVLFRWVKGERTSLPQSCFSRPERWYLSNRVFYCIWVMFYQIVVMGGRVFCRLHTHRWWNCLKRCRYKHLFLRSETWRCNINEVQTRCNITDQPDCARLLADFSF